MQFEAPFTLSKACEAQFAAFDSIVQAHAGTAVKMAYPILHTLFSDLAEPVALDRQGGCYWFRFGIGAFA